MSVRYGAWAGGPDPLEPPYDVTEAVSEIGDAVLDGASPAEALQSMMRKGLAGRRGLDALMREARARRRAARERGQLDGTLQQVRELLDRAVEEERRALFPDPDDRARMAEAELDSLPSDTARAVRRLADYQWTSPEAAATYEEIRDLLRREVLDSQFRGMKQSLEGADPEAMRRVKDMLADLNAMLDADAQGQDTSAAFAEFMDTYGDMFPEQPQTLEELADSLARRAAAAQRMLASLSREQREELANLMSQALGDADLQSEMDRLRRALQARRPDLDWSNGERMTGDEALGMGDATTALEELADLDDVESALRQDYPGASLDDVDLDARRARHGTQRRRRRAGTAGARARADRAGLRAPHRRRARADTEGGTTGRRDRARPRLLASSTRAAAATTTSPTRARRASSPARRASGATATSSRSTSCAPSATPSYAVRPGPAASRWTWPTSRWSRQNGVRRPRSACSSTCPTRWRCAARGVSRSPPRSPCTR